MKKKPPLNEDNVNELFARLKENIKKANKGKPAPKYLVIDAKTFKKLKFTVKVGKDFMRVDKK